MLDDLAWMAADDIVTTELGEGLALLNLRTNEYFSLNEVGAFIWSVLPRARGEIIEAIIEKYDVTADDCAGHVDLLLEDLRNAALAEPRPAAAN